MHSPKYRRISLPFNHLLFKDHSYEEPSGFMSQTLSACFIVFRDWVNRQINWQTTAPPFELCSSAVALIQVNSLIFLEDWCSLGTLLSFKDYKKNKDSEQHKVQKKCGTLFLQASLMPGVQGSQGVDNSVVSLSSSRTGTVSWMTAPLPLRPPTRPLSVSTTDKWLPGVILHW